MSVFPSIRKRLCSFSIPKIQSSKIILNELLLIHSAVMTAADEGFEVASKAQEIPKKFTGKERGSS
jgi:hypothetical protein